MYYRLMVVFCVFSLFFDGVSASLSIKEVASSLTKVSISNAYVFGGMSSCGLKSGCVSGFINSKDIFRVKRFVLDSVQERFLDCLGFCRAKEVINENHTSLLSKITNFKLLPKNCKYVLSSSIRCFKNQYGTPEDIAERLSILTAFTVPWDEAISLLRDLCSDGGFSHEYSLTEALFVLHMKPEVPNFAVRLWRGKGYDDEMLFYAKCLAGALACALKNDKKIPEDFEFDMSPCSDQESFVTRNIGRLLTEYVKTFPDDKPAVDNSASKKVAAADFSSHDSSRKLKKD